MASFAFDLFHQDKRHFFCYSDKGMVLRKTSSSIYGLLGSVMTQGSSPDVALVLTDNYSVLLFCESLLVSHLQK